MPFVLLLCVEVFLCSLHHALHVVGLIHILTAVLAHPQSQHPSILLHEDALECSLSLLRFFVLHHQNVLIQCDLIEIDIAVELIDPLVGVGHLQFQWSEHLILIVDLLAVQPGVTVVELEHVQTFLHGIDGVLELAYGLLMGEEEGLDSLVACDFSEVVQFNSDVVVRHIDPEVKNGEVLKNLEVAEGSCASLYADFLCYSEGVVGVCAVLRVGYGWFFLDNIDDPLGKWGVISNEVDELILP